MSKEILSECCLRGINVGLYSALTCNEPSDTCSCCGLECEAVELFVCDKCGIVSDRATDVCSKCESVKGVSA